MRHYAGLFTALLACFTVPLAAQETRVGELDFQSPPASIDELGWLIGQWEGEGIEGAPAMESWLPPIGGTMVGTFVQETTDGSIMFSEHMYLAQQDGSLVLKLKHFNADLTGWEEKDDMVTFRLLALEPCAAYFNALTLRCEGDDGLVAAVRMKSDKPEPQELVFRFQRAAPPLPTYDCDGSTLEMNQCMAELLEQAIARKDTYLAAAVSHYSDRPEMAALIRASDQASELYRKQECEAMWEGFKDGSIRTIMSITCSIGLVDARTQSIWENWLTHMDSSDPVLPRPAPTR